MTSLDERARRAEAAFQSALVKIAELAASNSLKSFTGTAKLPSASLTTPKGLNPTKGLNPMQGMKGLGGGPSSPLSAQPAMTMPAALDSITQSTVTPPTPLLRNGATMPIF